MYVLDQDNTARARKLVPRARLADAFLVEGGIQKDERFVLEGIQKVKEGSRIEVRAVSPEQHGG